MKIRVSVDIKKVLVYYQLFRDEQAAHRATRTEFQELHSWYTNHKKPPVQQMQKTIDDLEKTNQTPTKERVNRTPNNNNNDNNSNNNVNNTNNCIIIINLWVTQAIFMTNIEAKEMTIQKLTKEIDNFKVHYIHSIDNDNNNTNHNIYVIISGEDRFPDQKT